MAFVVARRDGRFEIRESVTTPAGPRARTLAGFKVLSDSVMYEARSRATRPFDPEVVRARARALKVPERSDAAAVTARKLLAQLRQGERLPPMLAAELRKALPEVSTEMPDSLDDAIEWAGSTFAEKGRWVRELLAFGAVFPQNGRPGELAFPRIESRDL
jgi:hypothetical protein